MDEVLSEYFSSVFTMEKYMEASEFGEENNDPLKQVEVLEHIKAEKSLESDWAYFRMLWEARKEIAGILAGSYVSSLAVSEIGGWLF